MVLSIDEKLEPGLEGKHVPLNTINSSFFVFISRTIKKVIYGNRILNTYTVNCTISTMQSELVLKRKDHSK